MHVHLIFVTTSRFFPHSGLSPGSTRRVPLVEQELLTLPEHVSSPPVFSGVHVTRSLVLCVCFVDRCLFFCIFFFWPLYCLYFFDMRTLITPLVSSNSFYNINDNVCVFSKLLKRYQDCNCK